MALFLAYVVIKHDQKGNRQQTGRNRIKADRPLKGSFHGKDDSSESRNRVSRRCEKRQLAIIIDDVGQDKALLEELLRINLPITISILPYCRYSTESAEKAHLAGRDILLHLPMEPHGYPEIKPGAGALLTTMNPEQIEQELSRDLKAVPFVKGVNNHMGSRFMEDEQKLEIVFRALRTRKMFFIDSRTTVGTKARESAEKIGIKFLSRDAFIDNGADAEQTYQRLLQFVQARGNDGRKVLIGHPYPGTISALKRIAEDISRQDVEVVSVSRLH